MVLDIVTLPDFYERPLLHKAHEWLLSLTLPNGLLPNIDDSNLHTMPGALLGYMEQDGRYIWNWTLPSVDHAHMTAVYDADQTLMLLEDLPQPTPPTGPQPRSFTRADRRLSRPVIMMMMRISL